MSELPFDATAPAPAIPDYTTVEALTDGAFADLARQIKYALTQRDIFAAQYAELSARAGLLLRSVDAPKSLGALGLRFTQTAGRKGTTKTDPDALRMELERRLPEVPVAIFVEAWKAAMEAATTVGKTGEPGLTIAPMKEEVA